MDKKQELKKKIIVTISVVLLLISVSLQSLTSYLNMEKLETNFEYINIKDMAEVKVATKSVSKDTLIDPLFTGTTNNGPITEVSLPSKGNMQEVKLPEINKLENNIAIPKQIWRLPTERGIVTQNPSYGHVAFDITSPRGSNETIFPVANGKISSIYTDNAGALVITVLHNVNGKNYTSQYAHLSRYANGLYVGKQVTVNDALGQMGTTGYSTGIHLHLAVVDCALFVPSDKNCSNLNGFFNYARYRYNQGYTGLGSMMKVPGNWNQR